MNSACNPLPKKGVRNVFCSFYKGCLDHAVRASWPYWDCGDCRHKLDQGARPEMRMIATDSLEHHDLRVRL
jgi:hypothetical protein